MQKEEQLLEKRLIEKSRMAYNRDIVIFSDFLNLNELNILHSLPKESLYTRFVTFGGYDLAERQMAAFLPDALSLREKTDVSSLFSKAMSVLRITPLHEKYAENLNHRDYLGAILNLGIDRATTGDIVISDHEALLFIKPQLKHFLMEELTRVRHTTVLLSEEGIQEIDFQPKYEEIQGTVASVRLDSLLSLAFGSSRSKLTGYIEGAKVFVNGKLITSNGYHVNDGDIISVRGLGKFRFCEALHTTKKKRIVVRLWKYI